jgi:uncharacterized ParB-like nuclease family protein
MINSDTATKMLNGRRFFYAFSVCGFERACNSNEDALLMLAPVSSSTSTVILLWDKARKSILSGK